MKRKLMKIMSIVLTIICLAFIFNNFSYAAGSGLVKNFDGTKTDTVDVTESENIAKSVISTVLSVTRIIAAGIAIIMLTYLGIQYMSAAPQEKANIKNKLITFTIGAVIVFSTVGILEKIQKFASGL